MGNFFRRPIDDPCDWVFQHVDQDIYPLYKYVNVQKEGILVDVYMNEGREAVVKVVEAELADFLYDGGRGDVVKEEHYITWRRRRTIHADRNEYAVLDERMSQETRTRKFEQHHACWNLEQRGGVGETLLHICVLHDEPLFTDIAKILLQTYPKMSLDYYEGDEYFGESALHLAIVAKNFELVRLMVEKGADVNQRATGRFLLPEDQKRGQTGKTDYQGYAYYGEYPLAFAACFGYRDIYDYLIKNGADPNLKDKFGNSVLHMIVINNQTAMCPYVVQHHTKKAEIESKNEAGLTPLTLASKLGHSDVFKEIIELQSEENWRYSNMTCRTYPLAPLDTIGPRGETNWSSVLISIVNGETDGHLEMLDGEVIRQLLYHKWNTFARHHFIGRFFLLVLHLISLSIAVYCRPTELSSLMGATDPIHIVRFTAEVILCFTCLLTLVLEFTEVTFQGPVGYIKSQKSAPTKAMFNISCLLILACIPVRLLGKYHTESILLTFSTPFSWAFLLFFARGLLIWGPFVVMVYKMFALDHVKFCLILAIFIVQFSQAFHVLFKDIPDKEITSFKTFGGSTMKLFHMTFGEFEYDEFHATRHQILTKIVFFLFAMLVPILLLNMLIAMMGRTYQETINRSEKEWWKQWAKCVIVVERTISSRQLQSYQDKYSVRMKNDASGFMVIKRTSKTKAQQRHRAIINWQKLIKGVKNVIQTHKQSGKTGPIDLTSMNRNRTQTKKVPASSRISENFISILNKKRHQNKTKDNEKPSQKQQEARTYQREDSLSSAGKLEGVVLTEISRGKRGNKITPTMATESV